MSAAGAPASHSASIDPLRTGLILGYVAGTSGLGLAAAPIVGRQVAADLGVATAQTAWLLALFSLAVGVSTPIWGRLADLYGGRRVIAAATACSLAGTLVVLVAPALPLLLGGRILQGAAAAGLSIVAFSVPAHRLDPAGRARALGVLTAVAALTMGAGPLVGAVAEQLAGWRAALSLSVIMLAAVPALARLAAPPLGDAGRGVDLAGAALVAGVAIAISALLQVRATGLSAPVAIMLAVLATAGTALLVGHVGRAPEGFLPLAVVRNTAFVALALSAGALMAGFLSMGFLAPLLLTEQAPRGTLEVGALLLPAAACAAATAHAVGVLRVRVPAERILATLGIAVVAGMVAAGLGAGTAALVVLGAAAATSGFAGAQVALLDRIPELVAPADRGVAIGVFNLTFVTVGTAGAALAGAVVDLASLRAATLACAAFAGLAIPAARYAAR